MRIALTGGIAAGKSTVAARLAELGAVVIDADVLAREVVEPGEPALAEIVAAFGDGVLTADGALDRPALGAIVFSDPERRAVLNGITHPAIRRRAAILEAAAREADPDAVVVHDIPLLVEGRGGAGFDRVVVAHAPAEVRRRRLVELRGMSEAEAAGRIGAQATDEERLAIADDVIETTGSLDGTRAQVDALWGRLRA